MDRGSRSSKESVCRLHTSTQPQVSGEALQGTQGYGIDSSVLQNVAEEVAEAWRAGVRIAIVVRAAHPAREWCSAAATCT